MMHYFAYGSNMSPTQMRQRCPGSRPLGPAMLPDWRFIITKRGTANIRPEPGAVVYGVLWSLEPRHIVMLDQWEGIRMKNFQRRFITVTAPDRSQKTALSYISQRRLTGLGRPNYMLTALLPGAQAFDLPPSFIAELHSWLPSFPIGERNRRYIGRRKSRRTKRN